jgi:hypothetical protein
MTRKQKDSRSSANEDGHMCRTGGPTEMVSRHRGAKLALPVGEPDLEALRSVTREWLVPLLVEKFLREEGIQLRGQPNAGARRSPNSNR